MSVITAVAIVLFIVFVLIIVWGLKSPFTYPYFDMDFDVSGRRKPSIDDLLDEFLINGGFTSIQRHEHAVEVWKTRCENDISNRILKNYRRKQYLKCIDDAGAYRFRLIRAQTRYRQVNYIKTSYKVDVEAACFSYAYEDIENRNRQLADIGFECTLRQYHEKNQRKMATRKLREEIMERDNYTCQICGKYMPEEIGLQIDHIIPVSKGGKTVRSNLRVLCSKCNGSKSNKIE